MGTMETRPLLRVWLTTALGHTTQKEALAVRPPKAVGKGQRKRTWTGTWIGRKDRQVRREERKRQSAVRAVAGESSSATEAGR